MSPAESILEAKAQKIQALALRDWNGYERLGLVEIVRAADQAAFGVTFISPDRLGPVEIHLEWMTAVAR